MRGLSLGLGLNAKNIFTPLSLSSRLSIWLDPLDALKITDPNGAVSLFENKGSGGDATQATGSLQPVSGSRTISGRNVLDYDGADLLSIPALNITGDWVYFTVVNIDSSAPSIQYLYTNLTRGVFVEYGAGTPPDSWGFVGTTGSIVHGSNLTEGTDYILSVRHVSGTTSLFVNGVPDGSGSVGSLDFTSQSIIGSRADITTLGLDGVMGDVILTDGGVTDGEFNNIGRYLSRVYNISWTDI